MSYYPLGGDLPLGEPDGSISAPAIPAGVDEVLRAYADGPQVLSPSTKHPFLQLSKDLLEVSVKGKDSRLCGWNIVEISCFRQRDGKGFC